MVQNTFRSLSSYLTSENGNISSWQSKGMSKESIKPSSTTDKNFDPEII